MTERPPEDAPDPSDRPRPPAGESPEQIADNLLRRLDTLDDRLRRSQQQMIALLDQKLLGAPPLVAALDGPEEPGDRLPGAPQPSGSAPLAPASSATRDNHPAGEGLDQAKQATGEVAVDRAGENRGDEGPAPGPATQDHPPENPGATPSRRPAWLSNALTVAVTAAVVVAALFLVGLL